VAATAGPARRRHPAASTAHDIEVLEENSDTSWAIFQALQQQQERGFEKTRPIGLQDAPTAEPARELTVDDVMGEVRRNNRVCPTPRAWQRLYDFLPNKAPGLPPVPATRAEWEQLPPLQKRARLRAHIEWAAGQGVLRQVHEALRKLPEERWQHL